MENENSIQKWEHSIELPSVPENLFKFGLSPSAFVLYLGLCFLLKENDGWDGTTEHLAELCGLPLEALWAAFYELKDCGLIINDTLHDNGYPTHFTVLAVPDPAVGEADGDRS